MVSWKSFSEKAIDDFKNKASNFNLIQGLNNITIANKMDMSYDFYVKHKMHAVERKLNAMINKKKLVKSFRKNWRHPLNRKIESYRVLLL